MFYKRLYDVGDLYEEIVEDNSQREITTVLQYGANPRIDSNGAERF